jgi:hypothetical protein
MNKCAAAHRDGVMPANAMPLAGVIWANMILPFLRRTGQMWKPILGWGLIAAGLGTIYGLEHWWRDISVEHFATLLFGANAVNVGAFVWMNVFIRCPNCGMKLFWHAVSGHAHPGGLRWFWHCATCPSCQYEPHPT